MLWHSPGLAGIHPSFRLSLGCAVSPFRLAITTDGPSALVLKGARLCRKEVQKPKDPLTTRVYFLFCPRAVWLGSPWVGVFSEQGLRDWAPSMASHGVSAVNGRSRETEEGITQWALWLHITFPPQSISQDPVTWSQPKCQRGWKTRSSLCASLCHAFF